MDEIQTIGTAYAAQDRPANELDRLFGNLSEQRELVSILEQRLRVVSNPQPKNETKAALRSPEGVAHLSVATDAVRTINDDLRYIIETLAV